MQSDNVRRSVGGLFVVEEHQPVPLDEMVGPQRINVDQGTGCPATGHPVRRWTFRIGVATRARTAVRWPS